MPPKGVKLKEVDAKRFAPAVLALLDDAVAASEERGTKAAKTPGLSNTKVHLFFEDINQLV